MPTIQDLLVRFDLAGIDADWTDTGGGCMAVVLPVSTSPDAEILITDVAGSFTSDEYTSDRSINGFLATATAAGGRAEVVYSSGQHTASQAGMEEPLTTTDIDHTDSPLVDPVAEDDALVTENRNYHLVDLAIEADAVFAAVVKYLKTGETTPEPATGSTADNLADLAPSDVARDIGYEIGQFVNENYFDRRRGLSYDLESTSETGLVLVAQADDQSTRRFRIHIEPVA